MRSIFQYYPQCGAMKNENWLKKKLQFSENYPKERTGESRTTYRQLAVGLATCVSTLNTTVHNGAPNLIIIRSSLF